MTRYFYLQVGDVSPFTVGLSYRTFVGTALDAGRFTVAAIDPAARKLTVFSEDGWTPLAAREITYDTDSLLPGDSFDLEVLTLRVGIKTGMDKLTQARRIARR